MSTSACVFASGYAFACELVFDLYLSAAGRGDLPVGGMTASPGGFRRRRMMRVRKESRRGRVEVAFDGVFGIRAYVIRARGVRAHGVSACGERENGIERKSQPRIGQRRRTKNTNQKSPRPTVPEGRE